MKNAANLQGGAVTIIDPPTSQELTFDNNYAISSEFINLNIGAVQTTETTFVFEPIAEDSNLGSAITISPETQTALANNNERISDTELTFSGDFQGIAPGDVAGTVIYNNRPYEVIVDSNNPGSYTTMTLPRKRVVSM